MQDFLLNHYLWLKALHLIAVMSWMAGLLYLPRLFVYHVDAAAGSPQSETFKIMERRLLKYIMAPASIVVWLLGGLMFWANADLFFQGWMHAKLLLVVLMTGAHHAMSKWAKNFAADQNTKSAKFFRVANEIPTLLMIAIVILAIIKPF